MSRKKEKRQPRTYKDLPGYENMRTVKEAREFDHVVECFATLPCEVSKMEQQSEKDTVWACCYTNVFSKNSGHIAALWKTNSDSVNSDEYDPLQVDKSIHKKVSEWFKKKNRKISSNKKPSGKKIAEASQKIQRVKLLGGRTQNQMERGRNTATLA